ncbi:NADPH:quinone reductase-like Zn-dependent oxidoreductase [Marisediminicola sp. UYEF4]|uniref:NAD(P)-dependent alcohol dehydrogenase n=1 Tax=Marisediminicola sp. UYEF4 TaxID=1756384 RepID=UPI003395767C
MKAILQDGYGGPDSLRFEEVDTPRVAPDGVLVRVHAASVHPDVWHVVYGLPYLLRLMGSGLRKPKNRVPGTDLAGTVESVGRDVTEFSPGDEVFGETLTTHQWSNGGAFAEYASVPAAALRIKPANVTFEQAAAVPTAALIALRSVRDEGQVRPGQRVLVNGAGGGVGSLAVQIAVAFGAQVTAVDSTAKLDLLRALGAQDVIDYTREDFTLRATRFDLIVDIPGNHSLSEIRRALIRKGTYVLIGHDGFGRPGRRWIGSIGKFVALLVAGPFLSQRVNPRAASTTDDPLGVLKALVEAAAITPIVDRAFPLAEAADAIRYLEQGTARGRIVVTM